MDSFIILARAMVLPAYDVEVLRCGIVTSLAAVCMNGRGFLQVLLVSFPQGPGSYPYALFITCEFPTVVKVDGSTFLVHWILVFRFD